MILNNKMTVIVDNTPYNGLSGEWGLSILVEHDGKNILVDLLFPLIVLVKYILHFHENLEKINTVFYDNQTHSFSVIIQVQVFTNTDQNAVLLNMRSFRKMFNGS